MFNLRGRTADELFSEACWTFKTYAVGEGSRNGPVLTIQHPATIELSDPMRRILYNPERDANPFFHMMEAIWMWAGRNDVKWISQFNKGIGQFAEDTGYFHGAYGVRWRLHTGLDQLKVLAERIEADPYSRQHVMQMWAAATDLIHDVRDKPCNTQILFRVINDKLDMTVFNRSNDLVWGALGANIVHMTMLHELMASSTGFVIGTYRVVSNNLHLYKRHWPLLEGAVNADIWAHKSAAMDAPRPLFNGKIDMKLWLDDAEAFCNDHHGFHHAWFEDVAWPMRTAYLDKANRDHFITEIQCPQWRGAAELWTSRRDK